LPAHVSDRLRVVALLDSPTVPAWLHRALRDVAHSSFAELVLVGLDARPPRNPAGAQGAWFRAYEAADLRFFRFPQDHAEPLDASALIARCPQRRMSPVALGDGRFALAGEDVKAIRAAHPDVVLKLGFPPLAGEIFDVPRLGVWSFDHAERGGAGTPPFVWEMLRGAPSTETALRATTSRGSRTLVRSFSTTDPTSLHRSRNAALWKSSGFVARALADAERDRSGADEALPSPAFAWPARAPRADEVLRFAGANAVRVVRNRIRSRREDYLWFVALRKTAGGFASGPLDGFRPVAAPPGRFFADPFVVDDGARSWLFVEDGDLAGNKAVIRCAEILADGTLGESHVVLERDYHLSYPFVFRRDGEWFMIPETSEHRTIELWRARDFPWRWQLERFLMKDVVAVDTTLLEHAGRLWLFSAMSAGGGSTTDELFLFHGDALDGGWTPHPRNPIVSDLRRARPAGPLFREAGQLFRPAQDCAGGYGSAVWVHRVDALDEDDYRETPVRRIDPSWCPGATATHTLGRSPTWEAIDGRKWVRRGVRLP
jgi:hypothetical protein